MNLSSYQIEGRSGAPLSSMVVPHYTWIGIRKGRERDAETILKLEHRKHLSLYFGIPVLIYIMLMLHKISRIKVIFDRAAKTCSPSGPPTLKPA